VTALPVTEARLARRDPDDWAAALGISREAIDVYTASDVIDLHVDSFIWARVFGYDLLGRHGSGAFGARFYSQLDLPRALEAGLTGAQWVITTNPLRSRSGRERAFFANVERLQGILASVPDLVRVVTTAAEYRAARRDGVHGAFLAVQGGNALDNDVSAWARVPGGVVTRVTLVHLTSSSLGTTSSPLAFGGTGLTSLGRDAVQQLDKLRIFVDLAHISPKGFWDAVEVHDRSLPLIVTHTGVSGVHPHWRNLDDDQIRAVADSGGAVGIMYHSPFLERGAFFGGAAETIARHLEHVVNVGGEDVPALGSDWDGAIVTPRDLPTCLELPRLVHILLGRGWKPERIHKALGQNYLRALAHLRG
jgi:membrane dipeptidase